MTAKPYRKRIEQSKERIDAAIRSNAKRFGHHGPDNLIETVRQREGIALDRAMRSSFAAIWPDGRAQHDPARPNP